MTPLIALVAICNLATEVLRYQQTPQAQQDRLAWDQFWQDLGLEPKTVGEALGKLIDGAKKELDVEIKD